MATVAEQLSGAAKPREFHVRTERIEQLVGELQRADDPELRATALELLQSVLELHGAALQRLLLGLCATNEGERALTRAIEDDLVSSVLLLHELHPDDLETRVLRALEKTRPYLHSHGGDVELLSIVEGVVRVRLHGTCGSCASSSITMKNAVEAALFESAPDIVNLIAVNETEAPPAPQLVMLKGISSPEENRHDTR